MKLFQRIMRSMMKGNVNISGHCTWVLRDAEGRVKQVVESHNLVVTAGLYWLTDYLAYATPPNVMDYLAVGTDDDPTPAAGDTSLNAEVGTRVQVAAGRTSPLAVWQLVATFAAANGTGALVEAGIFNAATTGTMFARQIFSVINKGASDSLQCTWQITFAPAA
jgi:hypothetical protein